MMEAQAIGRSKNFFFLSPTPDREGRIQLLPVFTAPERLLMKLTAIGGDTKRIDETRRYNPSTHHE